MIRGFRHKGLKAFFQSGSLAGIQAAHAPRLGRMLLVLDKARSPQDMNQIGWKLHPLKGPLVGHWSVWVSGNWRMTFTFVGEDAELVDYQDYHCLQERRMARMFNPPHPASILREDVLPGLNLSVTEAAQQLGVSRVTLSRLLNEKAGISPEMALRLEAWLGKRRGGNARLWVAMQAEYDVWQAEQAAKTHPLRVQAARAQAPLST